jgi:membrane protease YdiL (CAAX protease family)
MSANSLDKPAGGEPQSHKPASRWWLAIALPLWVLAGFGLAQVLLVGVLLSLRFMGVSFMTMNQSVLNAVLAACIYALSVGIVIGLPWWVRQQRVSKSDIGLSRLPNWMDLGLAPAGGVIYLIGSVVLIGLIGALWPNIDMKQVQQTGFSNLSHYYEYLLAFLTLIVVAPFFEELLFRGYLYGKLRKIIPPWVAVLIVSALFGTVHGQWNVAIDVFALSIVLCTLREITGNIWAGVLLHMLKNGVAFYFLFVNPALLSTMGG